MSALVFLFFFKREKRVATAGVVLGFSSDGPTFQSTDKLINLLCAHIEVAERHWNKKVTVVILFFVGCLGGFWVVSFFPVTVVVAFVVSWSNSCHHGWCCGGRSGTQECILCVEEGGAWQRTSDLYQSMSGVANRVRVSAGAR